MHADAHRGHLLGGTVRSMTSREDLAALTTDPIAYLDDPDPEIRRLAVTLATATDPRVDIDDGIVDRLLEMMTADASPRVRAEAAEALASRGIQAEVVNCRFLKPYDRDILKDVAERHRRVITIEEGAVVNGFGAYMTKELSALASERTIEVRCLGLPDRFIEHGAREVLLRDLGLDAEGIITEARRMIGGAVTAAEESA